MKAWQFYLTSGMGGLCLILAAALALEAYSFGQMQSEIEQGQTEIAQGTANHRVTGAILKDVAELSDRDVELRDLLARHGYTVSVPPTPESTPASR